MALAFIRKNSDTIRDYANKTGISINDAEIIFNTREVYSFRDIGFISFEFSANFETMLFHVFFFKGKRSLSNARLAWREIREKAKNLGVKYISTLSPNDSIDRLLERITNLVEAGHFLSFKIYKGELCQQFQ